MHFSYFQNFFSITKLEARELYLKSKFLSVTFENLATVYRTDYLEETRQCRDRARTRDMSYGRGVSYGGAAFRIARGAMHARNAMDRPSKAAQTMWKRFAEAQTARNDLLAVCRAHNVSNRGDLDPTITTLFELMAEHREIRQPERVIEGRRVFETLEREKKLATDLKLI